MFYLVFLFISRKKKIGEPVNFQKTNYRNQGGHLEKKKLYHHSKMKMFFLREKAIFIKISSLTIQLRKLKTSTNNLPDQMTHLGL